MSLQDMRDRLAWSAFGKIKSEAQRDKVCIRCGDPVDVSELSFIDAKEYEISGVCPACFAVLFPDDGE